jgi:hypothetical protein
MTTLVILLIIFYCLQLLTLMVIVIADYSYEHIYEYTFPNIKELLIALIPFSFVYFILKKLYKSLD